MKKSCLLSFSITLCVFFGCVPAFAASSELKENLDVDEAVSLAIKNNISLKEEEITLRAYKRSSTYSWNSVSPSVSAGASYTKPVAPSDDGDGTAAVYGTASISFTPALFAAVKGAKLDYENGKLSYESAVKTIELNVRKAFYKILYDEDYLKLQKQNLESAEKQYQQNLAKYNSGGISRLDVLSTQVSVATQKPKVLSAETTLSNDKASFKQMLGIPQETEISLSGSLDDFLNIGDITIEDVEINSTSLKILENKLEAAKTSVLKSRLNAYAPTLTGSYTVQRSKTGDNDAVDSGTLKASVTIPLDSILPWSSSAQNIASAKDSVESIELQIEDEKTSLKVRTESALLSIAQSKAAILSLQASANLAKETFDMTFLAYQRGTKDLLSLQKALDDVFESQVNLKSEAYSLVSSILDLENIIGVPFGTLLK